MLFLLLGRQDNFGDDEMTITKPQRRAVYEMDIETEDHGSIILFRPLTPEAEEWIEEHVQDDAQWWSGALAVEVNYADDLLTGMVDDGLLVN